MTRTDPPQTKKTGLPTRIWAFLVGEYCLLAAALFIGAQTWKWPAGWVFLLLFAALATPMTVWLARIDSGLVRERFRILPQKGQPLWDRIFMAVLAGLLGIWLASAGIDAVQFGWSHMPVMVQFAGALGMAGSLVALFAVTKKNAFMAPTVRILPQRDHQVVSDGPYGVIRHPFYAALMPFFPCASLLLGSWWALAIAVMIVAFFMLRCVLEERFLTRELPGYATYTTQVKYRLIPGVW